MKEKVLVVDDDSRTRQVLRRLLEKKEYVVIEAADGDEAVEQVHRGHPSLVLMDMHMPKLDGIATLDLILESHPTTRVIMVTGDGDEGRARLAIERGACDFLAKPFNAETLNALVTANLPEQE